MLTLTLTELNNVVESFEMSFSFQEQFSDVLSNP